MKTPISLSDFNFKIAGFGHYYIVYTYPISGKKIGVVTDNMPLIDATKNSENPKKNDLIRLKEFIKAANKI